MTHFVFRCRLPGISHTLQIHHLCLQNKGKRSKKTRRNCLVRGELKEIFPELERDNNLLYALCAGTQTKASNTNLLFSVWWGKEDQTHRCFIEVCVRDSSQRRSWYAVLDGTSINIFRGRDCRLSRMDVSQRSCWKQTEGWVGPRESVYESAGCNNQRVGSGDFMCGRQSIKWKAGLKRSDYDLTFSSALKSPAAEIFLCSQRSAQNEVSYLSSPMNSEQ